MLAAALAAAVPVSALAATPRLVQPRAVQPRYVPPAPARALPITPPRALATVDHPPADNLEAIDNGPRDSGRIALTFDADMTVGMLQQLRGGYVRSWYNREVRDVLDSEQVPATIFLTGLWAQTYPAEARSLAQDPLFEIGNHSVDHTAFRIPCYGMPGTVPANRYSEIANAQATIRDVTGVTTALFRFPGDCYDRSDLALARDLGLTVVSGDCRASDAFNQ